MSHYKELIKEEKAGAKEYRKLAMKKALEKKTLKKMAKDESRHARKLQALETKE